VRKKILAIAFLAICPLLFAQQALNNDAVIKLVKAGLSDDLIVTTINASAGTYDTSADGIIALKTAGVSDKVVLWRRPPQPRSQLRSQFLRLKVPKCSMPPLALARKLKVLAKPLHKQYNRQAGREYSYNRRARAINGMQPETNPWR